MSRAEVVVERLQTYSPEDAVVLGALRHYMSPQKPNIPLSETLLRTMIEDPANRVLIVARLAASGQIVSSETLNVITTPDVGDLDVGRLAWLGFVSTDPAYRGQGIFGKVWLDGLEWCEERGINAMDFTSNPHNPVRATAREIYIAKGALIKDTDYFQLDVRKALAAERTKGSAA